MIFPSLFLLLEGGVISLVIWQLTGRIRGFNCTGHQRELSDPNSGDSESL